MAILKLASIEEVNAIIDQNFNNYQLNTEELSLSACRARILAEDIQSLVNVPDYRRSMVDGYAFNSRDIENYNPENVIVLEIVGRSEMGRLTDLEIGRGQVVYVPTGGMVPNGADRVIMQELVERHGDCIRIKIPTSDFDNIIPVGGDIQKNSIVLKTGKRIRTQEIGAMAAVGRKTAFVYQQPRISILCTGDELVSLDEELEPGRIRDMNTITLKMIAEEMGCHVVRSVLVSDDYMAIKGALKLSISDSDLVVVSGGSSVGEKDLTAEVFEDVERDSILLHGIRVKPGKPTIIAKIQEKPVFGLPGHPVAALNIFRIFVSRTLNRMQKQQDPASRIIRAVYAESFKTDSNRDTFQMVKLIQHHGTPRFEKVAGESGMITLLTKADGYILVPSSRNRVQKGEVHEIVVID